MMLGILSCYEALARLDDYIDRELSPRDKRAVALHLKICKRCAQRFHFEAEIVQGLRTKLERIEAPPELLERIRLAIENEPISPA